MYTPLNQIQTFEYVDFDGQKHPVLFVLDPEKKGYINATAIAKRFGKEPKDWLKNQNICDYITALIDKMNSCLGHSSVNSGGCCNLLNLFQEENSPLGTKTVTYDDLVISIHGGTPGQNGTWLHPKLGIIFSRWMSAHFAVWCDEQIETLLHQRLMPQQQATELSPVLSKAMANLEQRFEQNINTVAQMLNH